MSINWSKAPEGATHYAPEGQGLDKRWFDMNTGEFGSVWYEGKWHVIRFSAERRDLIARPWNGEGLPPVGTVCEIAMFSDDVRVVEVLGYSGSEAWLRYREPTRATNSFIVGNPDGFRPIRTAEQIAKEEREQEIAKMVEWIRLMPCDSPEQCAATLYHVGYRKPL